MDLVFKNSTTDRKYTSKFFEKILDAGVRELKIGKMKVGISVNLVGEAKIRELNDKYRHKNQVTDVLSFPMDGKYTIQDTQYTIHDFGDLFICLPFAKSEAKRENIDMERKLMQLTVHGFLHLAGYDHEKSASEAKKMFKLEKQILGKVNF